MIRMIQSVSAAHAKAYYKDALLKSDYYLTDQELSGEFRGKLAARLGLSGLATKDQFFALCENRNPVTGEPLTPRTKENRTTGYDINFHCPKSVSIVHALSKDDHILKAFEASVQETMTDIEADSMGRIRKDGKSEDRKTGELAYVDFTHQTARPTESFEPDPHLHSHCYVFNATWDKEEQKIKAGQFREIKRNMPYYQALFHKRLSDKLMGLGYDVRRTGKSFEISGVPQRVIDLFSKRTNEIGKVAKAKGITGAKALDELGARTRAKKHKGVSMAELKQEWRQQIERLGGFSEQEKSRAVRNIPGREDKLPLYHQNIKDALAYEFKVRPAVKKAEQRTADVFDYTVSASIGSNDVAAIPKANSLSVDECIDYAIAHNFERASVLPYHRLAESAIRHSLGSKDVSAAAIAQRLKQDPRIITIQERGQAFCTTKEVLKEEQRMVELARKGRGKCSPLYAIAPHVSQTGQQRAAVQHILTTGDRVSIIRGVAGAGKTTLMTSAVKHIERAGRTVTVLAPSSDASRGKLREEGFKEAETVAKFLLNPKMQEAAKGQVIWVDEAGLLGTKDMTALLSIAEKQKARLILGGDTRQHASVIRGDALRILNTVGGIKTAEVNKIYRQQNIFYKKAVDHLANGETHKGFQELEGIGAFTTIDPLKPNQALVRDYLDAIKKGKTALVISPTHKQGDAVTNEIRLQLRKEGLLGKKEILASSLKNLNLTQAQKSDWRNYNEGQIVQFNQNLPKIKRGSQWQVSETSESKIIIKDKKGVERVLPLIKSENFDVFEQREIGVSKGDKLRITRNGSDNMKRDLENGQVIEVLRVSKEGKIIGRNTVSKKEYQIGKEYGHLTHAHCITSHASQGKTVDEVFISQPAATFGATNAKQFYVSVSRGRERARIYTDDKTALLAHAAEVGDRTSAIELIGKKKSQQEHGLQLQREKDKTPERSKDIEQTKLNKKEIEKDIDHERPRY